MFASGKHHQPNAFFAACRQANVKPDELYYIMLGVELDIPFPKYLQPYLAFDYRTHHVRGWVVNKNPHLTLLNYALEGSSYRKILQGWSAPEELKIKDFVAFESGKRYCVAALIEDDPQIYQATQKLKESVRHLEDERDYLPHVAVAYLNKNEAIKNQLLEELRTNYLGQIIRPTTLFA